MSAIDGFAEQLVRHFGIAYPPSRHLALAHDLERVVALGGCADQREAVSRLHAGDALLIAAAARVCAVGETYFMRETAALAALREHLIELARRGAEQAPIRLWSAACSTGEEAYSMAIVARETLGNRPFQVVGSDVRSEALERARLGRYRPWSFRDVDPVLRARWFHPGADGAFEVRSELRSCVRFASFNLVTDELPATWRGQHAVMCCNALIYFPAPVVASVGDRLVSSLATDGLLLLGANDPSLDGQLHRRVDRRAHAYAGAGAPPAARPKAPAAGAQPETVAAPPRRPQRVAAPAPPPSVATAPLPAAGAQDQLHSAESYLIAAGAHQNAGNHALALADLRRALFLDPQLALAHALAATSLCELGRRQQAILSIQQARRLLRLLAPDQLVAGGDELTRAALDSMLDAIEHPHLPRGSARR